LSALQRENTKIHKLLLKMEETLEVSFGDEEIERVNNQVVDKLLQNEQMKTFLRGLVVIE